MLILGKFFSYLLYKLTFLASRQFLNHFITVGVWTADKQTGLLSRGGGGRGRGRAIRFSKIFSDYCSRVSIIFFKKTWRKCQILKLIDRTRQVAITFIYTQIWALSVFFNFFNDKKWFFGIFNKVNNLFLHQSYLKSPLPGKLTW